MFVINEELSTTCLKDRFTRSGFLELDFFRAIYRVMFGAWN
jgi:hypothetical protein